MNDSGDRAEDRPGGASANDVLTESTGLLAAALREASIISGQLGVRVTGRHSGTIYLSNGQVTGADSSVTPDLRSRLLGAGLAADHADPADSSATSSPAAFREDLRRRIADGSVTVADVESVALSAILDATQSLLETVRDSPAQVSLHPGEQSTHGIDHHVAVDALVTTASERAAHCRRLAVDADQPVTLRRLGRRSGLSVDGTQWRLISRLDGRHTPRELARAAGTELYATLVQLDRLATAGLCTPAHRVPLPTRSPDATTPAATRATTQTTRTTRTTRTTQVTRQRRPGTPAHQATFTPMTGPPEWADDLARTAPTDPELIRRLISGLRALA